MPEVQPFLAQALSVHWQVLAAEQVSPVWHAGVVVQQGAPLLPQVTPPLHLPVDELHPDEHAVDAAKVAQPLLSLVQLRLVLPSQW